MEMPHKISCTRKQMHASGRKRRQAKRSRGQAIAQSLAKSRPNGRSDQAFGSLVVQKERELDDKKGKVS